MRSFLLGSLGALVMIAAFCAGSRWARPSPRYQMQVEAQGLIVVRLDRQTGTVHYMTPHWAADIAESWGQPTMQPFPLSADPPAATPAR